MWLVQPEDAVQSGILLEHPSLRSKTPYGVSSVAVGGYDANGSQSRQVQIESTKCVRLAPSETRGENLARLPGLAGLVVRLRVRLRTIVNGVWLRSLFRPCRLICNDGYIESHIARASPTCASCLLREQPQRKTP